MMLLIQPDHLNYFNPKSKQYLIPNLFGKMDVDCFFRANSWGCFYEN